MAFDDSPYLTGQGTYGPFLPPGRSAASRFWRLRPPCPAAQNSVIVYKDGTVFEGQMFGEELVRDESIHRVFTGGYKHVLTEVDDPLSYQALAAAGYTILTPEP